MEISLTLLQRFKQAIGAIAELSDQEARIESKKRAERFEEEEEREL